MKEFFASQDPVVKVAGLIVVIVVLAVSAGVVVALIAGRAMDSKGKEKVDQLFSGYTEPPRRVISEKDIEKYPEPVRRYLTYSGVVDNPLLHCVRLKQSGVLRMSPDSQWMPFEASQYVTASRPGFVWEVDAKANGISVFRGIDSYIASSGTMSIKAASLFPVVNASGPEMDEGSLIRYLAEMPWFPSAFLSDSVSFEQTGKDTVNVILSDGDMKAAGTMYISEIGRLEKFEALRYRQDTGTRSLWTAVVTKYGGYEGFRIPVKTRVLWDTPEGEFEWLHLEIKEIKSGVPERY